MAPITVPINVAKAAPFAPRPSIEYPKISSGINIKFNIIWGKNINMLILTFKSKRPTDII